jgi:Uncharacterized protein conserved in bacteria
MPVIYHITTTREWEPAREKGWYESPSLKEEGFIHCSQEEQVEGVLQRYFSGKQHLVKLAIDTGKLKSLLIYEWSPSIAQTFPHIYGPINTDAVIHVEAIVAPAAAGVK